MFLVLASLPPFLSHLIWFESVLESLNLYSSGTKKRFSDLLFSIMEYQVEQHVGVVQESL